MRQPRAKNKKLVVDSLRTRSKIHTMTNSSRLTDPRTKSRGQLVHYRIRRLEGTRPPGTPRDPGTRIDLDAELGVDRRPGDDDDVDDVDRKCLDHAQTLIQCR